MTSYAFDQMTASDAASFLSFDTLTFGHAALSDLTIVDTPGVSGDPETITISDGQHALSFVAQTLIDSSAAGFVGTPDGGLLELGGMGADALSLPDVGAGHLNRIEGFGGDDVIDMTAWGGSSADDLVNGGDGNDTITGSSSYVDQNGHLTENDILQGGAGDDLITGGDGNDHLYGNAQFDAAGTSDGNDTIAAGAGNDYVQGNAGDDLIDGGLGNDRLYGGAGNDSITGGDGNDYLQGNKGDDTLVGDAGNDTIHGGAGNDAVVEATTGDDLIFGDDGNDTLQGGLGIDTLTGGAGNDVFLFLAPGEAPAGNIGATGPDAERVDTITDFTPGEDHIGLFFSPVVFHAAAGVVYGTAADAEAAAQQLMLAYTQGPHNPGDNAQEIAAMQVGSDTYLFYNDVYGAVTGTGALGVNEAIKLVGVDAAAITGASFGF